MIMKKIIYSFVAMVLIGCNQQSRDLNTKIINDNLCLFTNESKEVNMKNLTQKQTYLLVKKIV